MKEVAVIIVLIAAMVGSISSRNVTNMRLGERLVRSAGNEDRDDGLIQRRDEHEHRSRDHARLDLRQRHRQESSKAIHAETARDHFLCMSKRAQVRRQPK